MTNMYHSLIWANADFGICNLKNIILNIWNQSTCSSIGKKIQNAPGAPLCDKIIYPSSNSTPSTAALRNVRIDFIPCFIIDVNIYPLWDYLNIPMLVKKAAGRSGRELFQSSLMFKPQLWVQKRHEGSGQLCNAFIKWEYLKLDYMIIPTY